MEKAAKHLTPVTLELGGKSPCIVDHTAKLSLAAKRIVFGKFLNCGQTCVAPDYVLVERRVKDAVFKISDLLDETKCTAKMRLQIHPMDRSSTGSIFDRMSGLIEENKVVYGGRTKEETLQIEPTILFPVSEKDAVMQEEIFGPVLPILVVENMDEAQRFVQNREKPLACYLFTSSRKTRRKYVRYTSFGGGCVNDTVMHLTTPKLPFGGVGNSGMGAYHGKRSFETFSHQKSIRGQISNRGHSRALSALPDVEKGGHPADWDEVRTFKPESNNRMHALRAFYCHEYHFYKHTTGFLPIVCFFLVPDSLS